MHKIAHDIGTAAERLWSWYWDKDNWFGCVLLIALGAFIWVAALGEPTADEYRCTNDPTEVERLVNDGWRPSGSRSTEHVSCYYRKPQ